MDNQKKIIDISIANQIKELNEESKAIYEDLKQTRNEVEKREEEMQEAFFKILGDIKLLNDNKKYEELTKYIKEEYEVLKKDLFDDYQSDEQTL